MTRSSKPIGVFDSGLGGLTIVRELRRRLPHESIVYFGDLARLPYGIKSKDQIIRFSIQNAQFLLKHKIKALIIACNSSSSAAYTILKQKLSIPVFDVIQPAVDSAVQVTKNGKIGVIATQATVDSGAYERALQASSPDLHIYSRSCGLFVPMVEEGWLDGVISAKITAHYLKPLKDRKIDTLILGCTHYPMLQKVIQEYMGRKVRLVNSAGATVQRAEEFLGAKRLLNASIQKGTLQVFVSDRPRNFILVGERFLGERLSHVQIVRNHT